MRRLSAAVGVAALLGVAAADLEAQARSRAQAPSAPQVRFGVQGSFGDDTDLGIGGRLVLGLRSMFPATPVEFHASFDYFFPDAQGGADLAYWELNGNVLYIIPNVRSPVGPYVGAGLNIAHASADIPGLGSASDTQAGVNFMGGVQFKPRLSRVRPFVEIRLEAAGGEQFVLAGGVIF